MNSGKFNVALAALIISLLASLSCGPRIVPIEGQVFIVTKGGMNYKLGLVDVKAYRLVDIGRSLGTLREEILKEKKAIGFTRMDILLEEMDADRKLSEAEQEANHAKALADIWRSSSARNRQAKAKAALEALIEQQKPLRQRISQAMELEKMASAETLFTRLPESIGQARTDADGKFSIPVPRGEQVILGAKGNRAVGDLAKSRAGTAAGPLEQP